MSDTILVSGASGHLGRAVVDHLLGSQGVAPSRIVAGTRDPSRLAALGARGIAIRRVDFDDEASLDDAFAGVGTVLVVSTDSLDASGTRLRQHKAAVAAAVRAGVGRIAYTSLANADISHVSFAPDHMGTEEAIRATSLSHLIFRNNWYAENLFMSLPRALSTGQWFSSAGDGRIAFVARDDIAAAIAGGLAAPSSGSATWTLTGSEAFTTGEVAALAAEMTGKPVDMVHLGEDDLAAGMRAAGVPEALVPTLVSFDTAARAGDLAIITEDVASLSGRKPRPLREFLLSAGPALAG